MEYVFSYGTSENYRTRTHVAASMAEARSAARDKRNAGWSVGRITKRAATGRAA